MVKKKTKTRNKIFKKNGTENEIKKRINLLKK